MKTSSSSSSRLVYLPRLKRLAVWLIISTGVAGAAKYTANLSGGNPGTAEIIADQSPEHQWDTTESWWNPEINLDELTERYTGERPFRIVTLEGYDLATASLQPSAPHEPFSDELATAPSSPTEPLVPISDPFHQSPIELSGDVEIASASLQFDQSDIFVSGEISGFLGDVVYLSSGESNFVGQFAAVPEPGTAGLLAFGALSLFARRRFPRKRF